VLVATKATSGGLKRSVAAKRSSGKVRSAAATNPMDSPATKRQRGTTATAGVAGGDERTVKVSVALPRRLWEEARAAVGHGSLSALVTSAVRREVAGRRTDAMLGMLDDIYGPVPADVQAEVDAKWRNL